MNTERIHHTCQCTGRKFTFRQWSEWLKSHESNAPQHTHNGFNYNIYDICLNPKVVIKHSCSELGLEVRVAQSDNNRWNYGVDLRANGEGFSFGVSYTMGDRGFPSVEDAKRKAIKHCIERMEGRANKTATRILKELLFEERQLSLF